MVAFSGMGTNCVNYYRFTRFQVTVHHLYIGSIVQPSYYPKRPKFAVHVEPYAGRVSVFLLKVPIAWHIFGVAVRYETQSAEWDP